MKISVLIATIALLSQDVSSVQLDDQVPAYGQLESKYLGGQDSGVMGIYTPSITEFDFMEWFNWIKDNFIAIKSMIDNYATKLEKEKMSAADQALEDFYRNMEAKKAQSGAA